MKFETTEIADLWAVRLERFMDDRGSFARLFCRDEFAAQGLFTDLAQASLSVTVRAGTVRGMHFQRSPHAEVKLVRCVRGAIADVIVDLRPASPSYLRWQPFQLDPAGDLALCIPHGCAHGFQTLMDDCEVLYQMSTAYAAGCADGVRHDDPALGIVWPREVVMIAPKDLAWPLLAERAPPF
jgi:dTDP-4-dehydrorhamnose 3,5-epimerase